MTAMCSAHNGCIVDMATLGDGLATISAQMLRYHAVGGLPQATIPAPEVTCVAPRFVQNALCLYSTC